MGKGRASNKNNSIELMRFLFTSCILCFHIAGVLWGRKKVIYELGAFNIMFFRNGAIGVEFFFLVSGYLLAASVFRKNTADCNKEKHLYIAETTHFIWKKLKSIWPYYIPVCALVIFDDWFFMQSIDAMELIRKLPSLAFTQELYFFHEFGFTNHLFIGPAWYISSMLITMTILYPILKNHFHIYTRYVGLAVGILLVLYIAIETGNLAGNPKYLFFTTKHNLRALAEISIGASCFVFSGYLQKKRLNGRSRTILSVSAGLCYIVAMFYACTNINRSYSALVCFLLAYAIAVSFSGAGTFGRLISDNKLIAFFGAITLPTYLAQIEVLRWVNYLLPDARPLYKLLIMYCAAFIIGAILHFCVKYIKCRIEKLQT